MEANGDTDLKITVDGDEKVGLGSFHKTLRHNQFGEVNESDFRELVRATRARGAGFDGVNLGEAGAAPLVNPQAGLASDRLTPDPRAFGMLPAPRFLSTSTDAEMVELYWMAALRDVDLHTFDTNADVNTAAKAINKAYKAAKNDTTDPGRIQAGLDVPATITRNNVFRCGLPGEEVGPLVSQFFLRSIRYGTQSINQRQNPYTARKDYLTTWVAWLAAQRQGRDADGKDYSNANSQPGAFDSAPNRYMRTMRDLARFVHKDALHQAYFNAALILMNSKALWTPGNPYRPNPREAGFGVLGGPHLLSLVSEVASRALKIVWYQKWQTHLRLRPEVYGGRVYQQLQGRPYGLPLSTQLNAALDKVTAVMAANGQSYDRGLLPMAFTSGSPVHPAYGAGHATVAGACVTVLKAWFDMDQPITGLDDFTLFSTEPGLNGLVELDPATAAGLTIEGELNKLACNVAMGRSIGGVHWRSDNTRSLRLGEAIAAFILAEITTDINERATFPINSNVAAMNGPHTARFDFRSFDGKAVVIREGRVEVNGEAAAPRSML